MAVQGSYAILPKRDTIVEEVLSALMQMPTFCPYIGVGGDRTTRAAYPSAQNTCYARGRPGKAYSPVSKAHQREFCLAGRFEECPYWVQAAARSST